MHLWTSIFQIFPPAELPAGRWKRASLRPSRTGSKSGHTRCDSTMQKTEPLSIRHDFDFARIADWKLIEKKNHKTEQDPEEKKEEKGGEKEEKKKKKKKKKK